MGVMVIPILQLYYLQAPRIIMKAQMSSSVDVAGWLQQYCTLCCEKCPLCGRFWKYVLVVDYLPIGSQLASLCKSSSHCLESLELWCQWEDGLVRHQAFNQKTFLNFGMEPKWGLTKHFGTQMPNGNYLRYALTTIARAIELFQILAWKFYKVGMCQPNNTNSVAQNAQPWLFGQNKLRKYVYMT